MSFDLLSALALFALITSSTPGPNNLMLMASGGNYGFRQTIPHMLGIVFGFMSMLLLVGLGLIRLFEAYPIIYVVLKWLSVAYLLYLAWKIATAAPLRRDSGRGTPLTLLQAAAFQWVNPKAWAFGLSVVAVYAPQVSPPWLMLVALIVAACSLPAITIWTAMGQQLARVLTNPRRLRLFNWSMALLLVLSLYPVIWSAA
ncbi:LysE family translocator [Sulfitobacter aestuarii]|uniref:LysE family translocator n=1 Tax=Sulfitobacter aestuarii TaxID=2161676 RepID=A0ABW5TYI6_9RHOB